MMKSSKLALLYLGLLLIQCTIVECWFWWSNTPKYGCEYPGSNDLNSVSTSADYFYGTTSLFKGRKREFSVFKWKLNHSLLMFRGKIFEWGLGDPKTYKMNRDPSQCSISWSSGSKGTSKCLLSDVEDWTKDYPNKYGKYNLLRNNCHFFVNRLVKFLNTNCGH